MEGTGWPKRVRVGHEPAANAQRSPTTHHSETTPDDVRGITSPRFREPHLVALLFYYGRTQEIELHPGECGSHSLPLAACRRPATRTKLQIAPPLVWAIAGVHGARSLLEGSATRANRRVSADHTKHSSRKLRRSYSKSPWYRICHKASLFPSSRRQRIKRLGTCSPKRQVRTPAHNTKSGHLPPRWRRCHGGHAQAVTLIFCRATHAAGRAVCCAPRLLVKTSHENSLCRCLRSLNVPRCNELT